MSYWNGDEWRWRVSHMESRGHRRGYTTISVIDAAASDDPPRKGRRVPFGFGVRDLSPVDEPQTWEGDNA